MAKTPEAPKKQEKDTTFRLLKPGKQFATNGPNYARPKDPKAGGKKIDAVTKKSFVPFHLIAGLFTEKNSQDPKKALEGFTKKFFESEIFEEIPKKYLKPVLPPGLVKK